MGAPRTLGLGRKRSIGPPDKGDVIGNLGLRRFIGSASMGSHGMLGVLLGNLEKNGNEVRTR